MFWRMKESVYHRLECGNVAYRIFHLNQVSRLPVSRVYSKNSRITDSIWGLHAMIWWVKHRLMTSEAQHLTTLSHGFFPMMKRPKFQRRRVQWVGTCDDYASISWTINEQLLSSVIWNAEMWETLPIVCNLLSLQRLLQVSYLLSREYPLGAVRCDRS